MISRELAIDTLQELVNTGIFDEDITSNLEDIISCLEAEMVGRHEWGVPNEKLCHLYGAVREDLVTDELIKETHEALELIRFIPSKYEYDEIKANLIDDYETWNGEIETEEDMDFIESLIRK